MDHHSMLDHHQSPDAQAAVAPASVADPLNVKMCFPAGDEECTALDMANADLDAALQLLADRAQYVTGASGAAIALRRSQQDSEKSENDVMICRASAGSNAPQLGALLSTEHGLSGESLRTCQLQRCNNAQNDARVNRETCRRLGIASVLVMPILSGDRAIGVFELFSGKAYAFDETDISVLHRLSAMVHVALKLAAMPELPQSVESASKVLACLPTPQERSAPPELPSIIEPEPNPRLRPTPLENPPAEKIKSQPTTKKPLFWSAAAQTSGSSGDAESSAPEILVPPVLRNLQKCQACGFPVSKGRTLCVECEEKQWRGRK
jgi:hypothetical protein